MEFKLQNLWGSTVNFHTKLPVLVVFLCYLVLCGLPSGKDHSQTCRPSLKTTAVGNSLLCHLLMRSQKKKTKKPSTMMPEGPNHPRISPRLSIQQAIRVSFICALEQNAVLLLLLNKPGGQCCLQCGNYSEFQHVSLHFKS